MRRSAGNDEVRVVAGDLDGSFMAMYGHGGRLRGVLGIRGSCLLAREVGWVVDVVHGRDPEPAGLTPFALVSAPDREKLPAGIEDAYPLAATATFKPPHAPASALRTSTSASA